MPNDQWPEVYKKLGVRPVINAQSWVTSLGGSLMRPEVLSAMEEASTVFVDMIELNKSAGKVIARICDSEGGLVTSGCSAAQVLMVAACMTGNDDLKVEQLPDTTGMKNNVVMFKGHRNRYDKAFQTPGAMIVEFGNSTDASDYQLESAIDGNTCAVAYVIMPFSKSGVGLKRTIDIAHKHGVPVIVDAAAEVPPRSNLSKFISMGADMVAFSGGKGIGGPQSTGILAGKKNYIDAAFKNSLNLHSPIACIGRPMKVSKENIIGLVTALELYIDSDEESVYKSWRKKSEYVLEKLGGIQNLRVVIEDIPTDRQGPQPVIYFEEGWGGISPEEIRKEMSLGDPPIFLGVGGLGDEINIVMTNVMDGEEVIIVERLNEILNR